MIEPLKKLVDNLVYWLAEHGDLKAEVAEDRNDAVELELIDDEGEEFYIGSYADPGMLVRWIGPTTLPGCDEPRNLVEVNGVIFEAVGRTIAGWAIGLQ